MINDQSAGKVREDEGRTRRSPCPVACALDIFGDRWSLLVIRDLLLGKTRFKDFIASPEGIPTNILSERLSRLSAAGLVRQVTLAEGARHLGYGLTAKGRALLPVLGAMRDWGLRWEKGTQVMKGLHRPASRGRSPGQLPE